MLRVIFFVTTLNSGGLENYLLRFLKEYNGKLVPVIVCKGGVIGELKHEFRKIKYIKIHRISVSYLGWVPYYKIYKLIKRENCNVACDFTGNFAGLILFISAIAKVKVRIAFYRGASNHFRPTALNLCYNYFMKQFVYVFATNILFNSYTAMSYFFKRDSNNNSRFRVIYNGINAEDFIGQKIEFKRSDFGVPEESIVVGHVGRYNQAKNHVTMMRVAEIICSKYDSVYFVFCGKDVDSELELIVARNELLKHRVKLIGYRRNVRAILEMFDLFFFPSLTEGQPNALIEAMICGLPILASNIGAIRETVPSEFQNRLLEPLDVNGFVEEISYFCENKNVMSLDLSRWARNQFDHRVLFGEFFDILSLST